MSYSKQMKHTCQDVNRPGSPSEGLWLLARFVAREIRLRRASGQQKQLPNSAMKIPDTTSENVSRAK